MLLIGDLNRFAKDKNGLKSFGSLTLLSPNVSGSRIDIWKIKNIKIVMMIV